MLTKQRRVESNGENRVATTPKKVSLDVRLKSLTNYIESRRHARVDGSSMPSIFGCKSATSLDCSSKELDDEHESCESNIEHIRFVAENICLMVARDNCNT